MSLSDCATILAISFICDAFSVSLSLSLALTFCGVVMLDMETVLPNLDFMIKSFKIVYILCAKGIKIIIETFYVKVSGPVIWMDDCISYR